MKKVRLENINKDLKDKLKDKKFKRLYEIECAKVAVAQKIAELRQDSKLRQVDLAKKMGTSQQFISQIETGEEKNLTISTLIKIAECLGREVNISFPKQSKKNTHCLKIT